MTERSFVDSNVLVYLDDRAASTKREQAEGLVRRLAETRQGVLSTQVLAEYFAAAVGKLGVPAEHARAKVAALEVFEIGRPSFDDLLAAIDLHRLHGFHIWDALIVRMALVARCSVLYSEDFQDDRRIDGLRIVNPFRFRPLEPDRPK
ncbi:MAG TPA: PIN domain-containing protein [Acidobacteriota bacterium]